MRNKLKLFSKLFLVTVVILVSCKDDVEKSTSNSNCTIIESDLEEVIERDGELSFTTTQDNFYLGYGGIQSTTYARSGRNSIRLDSSNKYGLSFTIDNVVPGEFFHVSVWQKKGKKDGVLTLTAEGKNNPIEYRTYYENRKNQDDWFQHTLTFFVLEGVNKISGHIFSGKEEVYFDDIVIKRCSEAPTNQHEDQINIYIPDSSKKKLNTYVSNSLEDGVISSANKQYVKAFILNGGDSIKIKMKLKGDWTDHLELGKISYRIKVLGDNAFHGLKSFSIQHPRTRNYLNEWVIHKMADQEDLLSTRYDFINVTINGQFFGMHAIEEHFDKQLLESKNRREGPILKLDESATWAVGMANLKLGENGSFPYYESTFTSFFKKNRTLGSEVLSSNLYEGQKLLHLFNSGWLKLEDIFDIDQLAKYYVLMELSGFNHGLRWHNRRFYYNPITQKLEHIIYDVLPFAEPGKSKFYMRIKLGNLSNPPEFAFDNAILLHPEFKDRFIFHLTQKTKKSYLDSVFNSIDLELYNLEKELQQEESHYCFEKDLFYEHAEFLREELKWLDHDWVDLISEKSQAKDWRRDYEYVPRKDRRVVKEVSLNAYLKENGPEDYLLEMENFHLNDIDILAFQLDSGEKYIEILDEPIVLKAYNGILDTLVTSFISRPKKVFFSASNNPDQILSKKIHQWEKPRGMTTRMRLKRESILHQRFYTVTNGTAIFKNNVIIDEVVLIPKNLKVEIKEGTQMEFKNGGGLIITNDLYAVGSKSNPIKIYCNDSTSNGFTVLESKQVTLNYVDFDGLSNLDYGHWQLTGAVVVHESSVEVRNVTITNALAEDGINLIRSKIIVENILIDGTLSDGIDVDFCTGELKNSIIRNTGNDCLDFSGSNLKVENIDISNSGDKGISVGEGSTVNMKNIQIYDVITAVAAKDNSEVLIEAIVIEKADCGFIAFQKKPEYGPAQIKVENCEMSKLRKNVLVEINSEIEIDGEVYIGGYKLNMENIYRLYGTKKAPL